MQQKTFSSLFCAMLKCIFCVVFCVGCGPTSNQSIASRSTSNNKGGGNSSAKTVILDLGVLTAGSRIVREIQLLNDSNITWTVDETQSDCGCIVEKVEPKVIRPDATARLTFDYMVSDQIGFLERRILVRFKEPAAPIVVLVIRGLSKNPFEFHPEIVEFGDVRRNQNVRRSVRVICHKDIELDLERAVSDLRYVAVSSSRPKSRPVGNDDGGMEYSFDVVASPSGKDVGGHFEGTLSMPLIPGSNDQVIHPLLRFRGEVVDEWVVEPSQLFFGSVPKDRGPVVKSITVRDATGKGQAGAASQLKVEHTLQNIVKISVCEDGKPSQFKIDVKLLPEIAEEEYVSGVVRISISGVTMWTIPVAAHLVKTH